MCASPFGKMMRIIRELLDLAEKRAMTIERSDAVYEVLVTAIENVNGTQTAGPSPSRALQMFATIASYAARTNGGSWMINGRAKADSDGSGYGADDGGAVFRWTVPPASASSSKWTSTACV